MIIAAQCRRRCSWAALCRPPAANQRECRQNDEGRVLAHRRDGDAWSVSVTTMGVLSRRCPRQSRGQVAHGGRHGRRTGCVSRAEHSVAGVVGGGRQITTGWRSGPAFIDFQSPIILVSASLSIGTRSATGQPPFKFGTSGARIQTKSWSGWIESGGHSRRSEESNSAVVHG